MTHSVPPFDGDETQSSLCAFYNAVAHLAQNDPAYKPLKKAIVNKDGTLRPELLRLLSAAHDVVENARIKTAGTDPLDRTRPARQPSRFLPPPDYRSFRTATAPRVIAHAGPDIETPEGPAAP